MQRIVLMLALVIAGELVFGLPFNVPRFFRPTMLEVFGVSNTQLGDMFAVYGVTTCSLFMALRQCWPIFLAARWPIIFPRAR
jgi:hypothetical protein